MDHPRSRGVYEVLTTQGAGHLGSSPLARGLPSVGTAMASTPGIIPARAGFTVGQVEVDRVRGDHPRSRGVYPRCRTRWACAGGSSPLARGLQSSHWGPLGRIRIIPARAGFTLLRAESEYERKDHPRSRGVYLYWASDPLTRKGSSPLARGLLTYCAHGRPVRRIIPARAGFTPRYQSASSKKGDHPRSRGVYFAVALARVQLHRIIPARAGFTVGFLVSQ